jgi:hypothetical protein
LVKGEIAFYRAGVAQKKECIACLLRNEARISFVRPKTTTKDKSVL